MGEVGYVYILENKAMPDIYKIGCTGRDDLNIRLTELFSTGVPLPFDCVYAAKVKDYKKVEDAIQNAFKNDMVHPRREFFRVDPDRVIPLLELFKVEEVTNNVNEQLNISEEDKEASVRFIGRRPSFKFSQMGINAGSKIILDNVENPIEVIVSENNKVLYKGSEYSLYPLTQELKKISYKIRPLRYWKYKGRLLQDIYNEVYLVEEE